MKVLAQHSTERPQDWSEVDSTTWAEFVAAVKRPLPRGGEALNTPGYLNSLCVMGLYLDGDHYAIEPYGAGGVKMSVWYDDLEDFDLPGYNPIVPNAGPRGRVWTFEPMRPIAAKGGMYQPRVTRTLVGSREYLAAVEAVEGRPITCSLNPTEHLLWDDWRPPPDELTLHGVWMPKGLHDAHQRAREVRGWREWADEVPKELLEDVGGRRRLKAQRPIGRWVKPDGTITWYLRTTDLANGIHAAANEDDMNKTNPASATGESSGSLGAGADELSFVFTSPSGEPNTATWPTGSYRCQFDVSAAGGDLSFGLRAAGGSTGHFARVDSGLSADGTTHAQVESLFTGIANHLATTGSVSWGTPTATDRWECLIACVRAPGLHGNQSFTIDLDQADSFTDGPWTVVTQVDVPLGTFTRAGLVPGVASGASVVSPLKAFTRAGLVPGIATGASLSPPLATFTRAGLIPSIATGVRVGAVLGTFTRAGFAPTIQTQAGVTVNVPLGAFTLAGLVPTVASGAALAIPLGTFTHAGLVPGVASGVSLSPPLKAFTRNATPPGIATGARVAPPAGAFTLSGSPPTLPIDTRVAVPLMVFSRNSTPPGVAGGAAVPVPLATYTLVGVPPSIAAGGGGNGHASRMRSGAGGGRGVSSI